MTTRAKLELTGLDQYLEQLKQAAVDIDAASQRALEKGGAILEADMEARAPVDEGNLKAHIVMDGPNQDGNFSYVEVGVINADEETAIYSNVQEYGSPSKNIKAQPYIRPAIDTKASAVKKAIRESLKSEGYVD